ncbi:MAG: type secretion protein [Cryobacterium sp.]|jgi:early secretory antigenic target protein ESAT-6|nr:type secretion protein [Cryobacterium sp.]
MTRYQVDSEAVLSAHNGVRACAERIQGEVGSLNGLLQGLEGSWSGQAASAFQGITADWRNTQQRVIESLAGLNQALALAAQQYAEAEQSATRLFGR